jgi:uncharacterized membrane protein YedE/YeeE
MSGPLFGSGAFGFEGGLLIALVVGLGFGFFLERAGLGNGRKLAAQFYLTDLSVFKVMFTAIITAMVGLFVLSSVGLIDISRIYMTPTYLVPQIVGGLIFGVGFVMGGYCPGTSCVAASSGRIDAGVLLLGMMLGVFLVGESYGWIEGFYEMTPLGRVTLPDVLHVPYSVVVVIVVAIAFGGFYLAEALERSNGSKIVGSNG